MRRISAFILIYIYLISSVSAQQQRVLVFIPGFMGSKLCSVSDEKVVWPTLRHQKVRLSREAASGAGTRTLKPCGVIDQLFHFLGWKFDQYGNLKNYLISDLNYKFCDVQSAGKLKNCNLIFFGYDWRMPISHNVEKLHQLLDQRLVAGATIDVLAHSMGGLIARGYIQFMSSRPARIRHETGRFITLGTPHLGSLDVFEALFEGVQNEVGLSILVELNGWLAEGETGTSSLRRTLTSFPGIYDMLPDYSSLQRSPGCCFLRRGAKSEKFDPFDPDIWKRFIWFQDVFSEKKDRDFLLQQLSRAKKFRTQTLNQALPASIETDMRLIANADVQTRTRVVVNGESGSLSRFVFKSGDGTVPFASATGGRDAGALGIYASDGSHQYIFDNDITRQNLRNFLIGGVPPTAGRATGCKRTRDARGTVVESCLVAWDLKPAYVRAGRRVKLHMCVMGSTSSATEFARADFSNIKVMVEIDGGTKNIALSRSRSSFCARVSRGRPLQPYTAVIVAPGRKGSYRVDLSVPGRGRYRDVFSVH